MPSPESSDRKQRFKVYLNIVERNRSNTMMTPWPLRFDQHFARILMCRYVQHDAQPAIMDKLSNTASHNTALLLHKHKFRTRMFAG